MPCLEEQMKGAAPILKELLGRWSILLRRNQKHSFPTGTLTVTHRAVNPFYSIYRYFSNSLFKNWNDISLIDCSFHIMKAAFNQICTIFHCLWSFAWKSNMRRDEHRDELRGIVGNIILLQAWEERRMVNSAQIPWSRGLFLNWRGKQCLFV